MISLLLHNRYARRFFIAHAQSSIGDQIGYIALVVLISDLFKSPILLSLVLLADFIPALALGSLFGALTDRYSRRLAAVASDLIRAGAFLGLFFADDPITIICFAFVAGIGSALFFPASMSGLPALVKEEQLPMATSLHNVLRFIPGVFAPLLAAALLLEADPRTLLLVNSASFLISAFLLIGVPLGKAEAPEKETPFRQYMKEGFSYLRTHSYHLVIVISSSLIALMAGMLAVAEVFLSRELGVGASGLALMITVYGTFLVLGNIAYKSTTPDSWRRRYILGGVLFGVGFCVMSISPSPWHLIGFALSGLGNGMLIIYARLLLTKLIPEAVLGRVFGIRDSLDSGAIALALLTAGVLVELTGIRTTLMIAGIGVLTISTVMGVCLYRWSGEEHAALSTSTPD